MFAEPLEAEREKQNLSSLEIMGKKRVIEKSKDDKPKEVDEVKSSPKDKEGSSKRKIQEGRVYINATYNNTLVTVTDKGGNVLAWLTTGSLGFSGPKKSTPFAASKVTEAILEKIRKTGPQKVDVFVRGIGKGRDSVLRTLASKGLEIVSIRDVTPIPHNGPRRPRPRRV